MSFLFIFVSRYKNEPKKALLAKSHPGTEQASATLKQSTQSFDQTKT